MRAEPVAATLAEAAVRVLTTPAPVDKVASSLRLAEMLRSGSFSRIGTAAPPERPARPPRPVLKRPGEVPRRRIGRGRAGRVALIHALAHIELNAIDLAWDMVARFTAERPPRAFYDDWVMVAAEEAKHHALLVGRLQRLGAAYGEMPAHDGLWQAASATAHDLLARLAVVPLVLEARGLDVTPAMVARLAAAGDADSAAILERIHDDEIGHVAIGRRWFEWLCRRRGVDPVASFHRLVRHHHKGLLKPPFNAASRNRAGFDAAFYEPLAED